MKCADGKNTVTKVRTSSQEDEYLVERFLVEKGLVPKRFEKRERRNGKTPDFKVLSKSDELLFYCETKTISEDMWLNEQLDLVPPCTIVGGLMNDPTFNNIANKIHEAVTQFNAVNANLGVPNVLFFVNHEKGYNFGDLLAVLTGDFYANSGVKYPIYRKFSEGRIKNDKGKIHLYLWFEKNAIKNYICQSVGDRRNHLCKCFDFDPTKIKELTGF